MNVRTLLTLLLAAAVFLAGCNKDDDDDNANPNDLTQADGWELEDVNTNFADFIPDLLEANDPAQTQITDAELEAGLNEINAQIENPTACVMDDEYIFLPNGGIGRVDGPVDCEDDLFQLEGVFNNQDEWAMEGNTLFVRDGDTDDGYEYAIRQLDASTLILFYTREVDESDFGLDDFPFEHIWEVELVFRSR